MADEVTPPAEEKKPDEIPPVTPPEKPPIVPPEDGEPGGDSPEAVFARKQYREAKQAREELGREKEARIRLEERLRLQEEQTKKKPEEQRVYTKAEIRGLVTAGQITQEDADRYEEEIIIPHKIQQTLRGEKARESQSKPLERAAIEIGQYKQYVPELVDKSSEKFQQAAKEYARLVTEDGQPETLVTEKMALRYIFGSLDDLKNRKDLKSMTRDSTRFHAEASANSSSRDGTNSTDISGASETQKAYWDKAKLTPEQKQKEWKIYNDLKGKKIGLR